MQDYKVIFLDFDGVINSEKYARFVHGNSMYLGQPWMDMQFDEIAIKKIAIFCAKTGAKIVITSSWRNGTYDSTVKSLIEKSENLKWIIPYVVGITPYCDSRDRGDEVTMFFDILKYRVFDKYKSLLKNGEKFNIVEYVIVDDDEDFSADQMNHLVLVDSYSGIDDPDFDKMYKILKIESK